MPNLTTGDFFTTGDFPHPSNFSVHDLNKTAAEEYVDHHDKIAKGLDMANEWQINHHKEIESSWTNVLKMIFICSKIILIASLLTLAIILRVKKRGGCDGASFMIFTDICIMVGLIFFEFGEKLIWAFFVMILVSNYINFMCFTLMLRRLPTPEGKMLRRKTLPYFVGMQFLYAGVLACGFTKELGPYCTSDHLYPTTLTMAQGLFVINSITHLWFHHKGYWLQWEEHDECKSILGKEEEFGHENIPLVKKVFQAQMKAYVKTQTILAIVMVLIQFFAHVVIQYSTFLSCHMHGKVWLYGKFLGSIFITFHMMCICMQAVMIMKVHFLIPRKLGYYSSEKSKEEKEREAEEFKETELTDTNRKLADNEDDGFKRVENQ